VSHCLFCYFFFFLAAAFFGAGAGAFAIAGCAATGLSVFLVANFIQTPFLTLCFLEAAFLVATAFFAGAAFFRDTAVFLAAAFFGTAAFFTGAFFVTLFLVPAFLTTTFLVVAFSSARQPPASIRGRRMGSPLSWNFRLRLMHSVAECTAGAVCPPLRCGALCRIFTGNARGIKRNVMLRRNFCGAWDDRGRQLDSGAGVTPPRPASDRPGSGSVLRIYLLQPRMRPHPAVGVCLVILSQICAAGRPAPANCYALPKR